MVLVSNFNSSPLKFSAPINEDLLKSLIEEYPLLSKLQQKLNIV
jgi:hypothetical protein